MTFLLVDVGATSFKWTYADGESMEKARRRPTPQLCSPETLCDMIAVRARTRNCAGIAIGFPGEVRRGVVVDAANLTRLNGPSSERDYGADSAWRNFELESAIGVMTSTPTVVVNDAHATAFGCEISTGRVLVVALGTGCGVGLIENGELQEIRDFGDDLINGHSLDQLAGEEMRRRDPDRWLHHCHEVVAYLVAHASPDVVCLAGGNAGRLRPHDISATVPVTLLRGEPAFRGLHRLAARAFDTTSTGLVE